MSNFNHQALRDKLHRLRLRPWQPSYTVVGKLNIRVTPLARTEDSQILATLFGIPTPPMGSDFERTLFLLRDLHVSSARLTREVIENAARKS